MSNFISLNTSETTNLIINLDNVECMYEMTSRVGKTTTQIGFVGGRTINVDGDMSTILKKLPGGLYCE